MKKGNKNKGLTMKGTYRTIWLEDGNYLVVGPENSAIAASVRVAKNMVKNLAKYELNISRLYNRDHNEIVGAVQRLGVMSNDELKEKYAKFSEK